MRVSQRFESALHFKVATRWVGLYLTNCTEDKWLLIVYQFFNRAETDGLTFIKPVRVLGMNLSNAIAKILSELPTMPKRAASFDF